MFEDENRTDDLNGRLTKMGKPLADAYYACNRGAHQQGYAGDLLDLHRNVERLVANLR